MSKELSISEEARPGEAVGHLHARDPDTFGTVTYGLVAGGDGKLSVSSDGTVSLVEPLDREAKDSYKLRVRASDGVAESQAIIHVKVVDTNDNPPVFLETVYSFDVSEDAGRGARVGVVTARDPDLADNGRVYYTVISDWANDVFSLNPQTGVFTLTARLDYEEVQHYIFVVEAEDGGKPALSSTVSVYINVLDINDNSPLFDPMSYSNELFENATIGTSVVTVSATDLDSDINGRVKYSILSGDDLETFFIDQENGTILTQKRLDRETKPVYNLVVLAADQAKPRSSSLSSTVQVSVVVKDVNDVSPEVVSPSEVSVPENAAVGALVLAVKAVDRDEGRNGYVEYKLGNVVGAGAFTLGAVDGLLRVAQPLDRESQANYTLELTVRDRGDPPRSTRTSLIVNVVDINDNSPVFDPKQYSASVPENASIGASVLQVSATDVDEGLNGRIRYAIVDGDENRDFSIGEDSGVVRVAKNLNFERKSRYSLTVQAEDCSSDADVRHDVATISVLVTDINDNPPTFLDSPYTAFVVEGVVPEPDGYVVTVTAYDADTQPFNGQVRYFLEKEGDRNLFTVNSSTGQISLMRPLDREEQTEYSLTIVAMDTGTPPLTGSGSLKIIVEDVNDHRPEFGRSVYVGTVSENLPVGTSVIHPIATDCDSGLNALIKYDLVGDHAERFSVDPKTGLVSSNVTLDREDVAVYYLTLVARDSSITEPLASAVNLTILVRDQNDNEPKFNQSSYVVYVPDMTQPGQFVFGAKAYDLDEGMNKKITYSLSGRDSNKFALDADTGVIKAATELNFNDRNYNGGEFKVRIIGTDGGAEPKMAFVELSVKIMTEGNFPTIHSPKSGAQFILPEDVEIGKRITKLSATSLKSGRAGVIEFEIAGSNIGDAIKVDKTTGEVTVAGSGLDYEASPVYEVWIEARDSDSPSLRSVLQILINITDSNDNPPVMEMPVYNALVPEEEPPELEVITVRATDADSGSNGIISYNFRDDANGTFSIDSETGLIYTNYRLDRETLASYQLIVEAIDSGLPSLTGTATVIVTVQDKNDNPPRFTRLFSVNVTENAAIGSFVIRIQSSDLDSGENANATYSFKTNPENKFSIDPATGNVTVAGFLDRETQEEYFLNVLAYDGAWTQATLITITIQDQNDNAPEFDHSLYSFNFPELQRAVVFVGQVLASDRDKHGPNSVISYALKHPSDLFSIDPASGELFSKRTLKYKHSMMDSSPENQYWLTILATDNGKPPMSSECMVTVNVVDANNNPPKFERREYFSPILHNAKIGMQILRVQAKDVMDYGINSELEYSIVGGNGSDIVKVDKNSGWVTLYKPLSSEDKILTKYVLTVRAIDHGVPSQYDEATVILVITGDNLHTPDFTALSYQVNVHENEPIGSTIVSVQAHDDDEGPNGMIVYGIAGGNRDGFFAVNPTTGAVVILKELDYDSVKEYKLNITANDLGFEPRIAKAMLTVILTDINDNPPTFNQTSYDAYLPENSPPDTFVFHVLATDLDSMKNAIIQYSIVGGSGKDHFRISMKTGEIYSKVKFNYEERTSYTLDILAVNPDSPMYGSTKVIIHISGVNEFYPTFVQPVFHFDVSESDEVGTSIGMVQATDQDAGDDGKVYYLFVGSSNDKGFIISPESGVISVGRKLDRETQNRIVLTVMAKNAGGIRGNDTDESQVIIAVQDGNDPPEFSQLLYEANISEAVPIGTRLATVRAVDKDVKPQNNQFSFSILDGNNGNIFKIDAVTGEIVTKAALDREAYPIHSLIIGAIDNGSPPETGSATVRVTVTDVNDNGPMFDPPQVIGYILENEPPNTSVMTLTATDPDLPPNGAPFTYTLVDGKDSNYFRIERSTGVLKTAKVIDREKTPTLEIMVEIEDSGQPKMRSQHPVTISVIDQNDSPSTPRKVHISVHSFNGRFPIGKIADVHPNDVDTSGDYRCTLFDNPSIRGLLSIPAGCSLHASKIDTQRMYAFNVSGNDGQHADVISSVSLEFVSFDNSTVMNSITIKIQNMTAYDFLTVHFKNFMDLLKNSFDGGNSPYLYSMHENDNSLELTVAVKTKDGYLGKSIVINELAYKQEAIQSLLRSSQVIIGYMPCNVSTCQNGGVCSEAITVSEETRITNSQSLILTSPVVNHEFTCRCPEGFTGPKCERRQDPCSPNPCQEGGTCRRQGFDFQCVCLPYREGKTCEAERGNLCNGNPCQNGGSCRESPDGSSFFCLCRPGYKGTQCELASDSCRPNPCMNGGICVSLKPGYRCNCPSSRHGRHCEKSTFGFNELSYMTFSALDGSTNDISIIFATTKPNALLAYNYGPQTGGRSDFVALELINGKAVFSYGGTRTAITSVSVGNGRDGASLADGEWHKITAIRNGRLISLSVASCSENGDLCHECKPGDSNCYANVVGPAGTLNFNNSPLYIGGVNGPDALLERPGQVHSDDLVGCVHSVAIGGRALNLSSPIKARSVSNTCPRFAARTMCSAAKSHLSFVASAEDGSDVLQNSCGSGVCYDLWRKASCTCDAAGLVSPDCKDSLKPTTLTEGSYVEFKISETHRRMQLLDSIYGGSTLWLPRLNDRISRRNPGHSTIISADAPPKHMSILFRTYKQDGVIIFSSTNNDFTAIGLTNGQLVYVSQIGNLALVNMTVADLSLSDGRWHNITLKSANRGLRVYIDHHRVGDELDSAGVHDFLDPYLTYLAVGSYHKEASFHREFHLHSFTGCLANFTINNEIQPLNGSGSIFPQVVVHGKLASGCAGLLGGIGAAVTTDPLSIGVSLVLVFFVVLLVAILASFIVFRVRRQSKEKAAGGMKSANGGSLRGAGPGGIGSLTGDRSSGGGHQDGAMTSFITENGDVIRGVGHHLVGPELISKKLVESTKVKKLDDLNFDFFNYHEGSGGNMRKYKSTPPHLPPGAPVFHKHAVSSTPHHRHSPHFGVRSVLPPPPVSRVDSPSKISSLQHQSTPLARLSPSSELSQQMPRILTLQDISGKPLQSALLAATSSSGGVGKDVLHSNSERSLNSPVMSQLSGQSSASRKTPGGGNGTVGVNVNGNSGAGPDAVGLTAEEISRLSARGRTSSLVSTLDAVSSSSGPTPSSGPPGSRHLQHHRTGPNGDVGHRGDHRGGDGSSSTTTTSTDESGNDSFTCSEIEYDGASVTNEKTGGGGGGNGGGRRNMPPRGSSAYDIDSSFRGSLSTLVASDDDDVVDDDDTSSHPPPYRPRNGSPGVIGLDYLLNWPNYESLVGVFKDIAEMPEGGGGPGGGSVPGGGGPGGVIQHPPPSRVVTSSPLRLPNGGSTKPSEEYV
ncbi:unnamed protein product [Nesidiocoris tenuis]|uniref:Cadherin-related tumor suppressor n=1 Tax=Nesidiocoris tenuis TaxID=355587 RepID=A0A6H5GYY8_9HEMI|nr:unnamed protein product [Nesidiocoris tenuis]